MSETNDQDSINETKKTCILKIATGLFAKFGFSGVGVRKIAEESGCNPAAISYYFGGKEKLFSQCLKALDHNKLRELSEFLQNPQDQKDFEFKLKIFCISCCSIITEKEDVLRLLLNELNNPALNVPDLNSTFLDPVTNVLETFIHEGMQKNILRADLNPILIAKTFIILIINELIFATPDKRAIKKTDGSEPSFEEISVELIRNCTGSIYA